MMELGGNGRMIAFLQAHGVNRKLPIKEKYATAAAIGYRLILKACRDGGHHIDPECAIAAAQVVLDTNKWDLDQASTDAMEATKRLPPQPPPSTKQASLTVPSPTEKRKFLPVIAGPVVEDQDAQRKREEAGKRVKALMVKKREEAAVRLQEKKEREQAMAEAAKEAAAAVSIEEEKRAKEAEKLSIYSNYVHIW